MSARMEAQQQAFQDERAWHDGFVIDKPFIIERVGAGRVSQDDREYLARKTGQMQVGWGIRTVRPAYSYILYCNS